LDLSDTRIKLALRLDPKVRASIGLQTAA
jgi:hypothetical protein